VKELSPNLRIVGKPIARLEGSAKVTGQARYAADISLPGLLWGKTLRSPHAHACIVKVDVSKARALPGVEAVIAGPDLPASYLIGRIMRDMPILAREKVRFIGEKVAAVASEDADVAEEALSLIEVEYEELPAVFDPVEAMKPDSPRVHESATVYEGHWEPVPDISNACAYFQFSRGDLESALRESDEIFEHTFRVQSAHQGYLEPHACVVQAADSDGARVWTSNKNPYLLRGQVGRALGLAEDRIVVHPVAIGGDFGGKGSPMDVPIAYLLSRETGRPVKMVMSYAEELAAGNPRHPGVITLRTGVKRDGRLCAMHVHAAWDTGAYGAFVPVPWINVMGTAEAAGCYRIGAMKIESYTIYTNHLPSGHVRAPGSPPIVFAVESHLDMIARALGKDPMEFRLENVLRPGDTTPLGHQWKEIRARDVLEKARDAAAWTEPKKSRYKGRGVALYDRATGTGESSASLTLMRNGQLRLLTPIADAGQGASTAVLQIAAEVLQVSPERIRVELADTATLPFDAGTGHSRTTSTAGGAAHHVAQELLRHLIQVAAQALGVEKERVFLLHEQFRVEGDSRRKVSFEEVAARAVEAHGGPLEFETRYSAKNPEVTSYCAQIAEVEVDVETGRITVKGIVTAHDVGTIINPTGHQGQIDGGVIYGMGYGLMEEIRFENGACVVTHLGDYKLPNVQDIPRLKTVLLREPLGPAPYLGRGIGEISNSPTAGAIANAVYDAVGVRLFDLPLTSEKVYNALNAEKGGSS
jgi:carbon-monoxide dehydrogenase large subunit